MNEAYRFAEVLESLTTGDHGEALSEAWARNLGLNSDSAAFLHGMSLILERMERIEEQIAGSKLSERSKRLYLEALHNLEPSVRTQLIFGNQVSQLAKRSQAIDLLYLAADALPHALEAEINPLTLDALILELDGLISEVREADIDSYLKKLVIAHLSALVAALRHYPVYGQDGVARIMSATAVQVVRLGQLSSTEPEQSVIKRAISTVKKVGAAIVWSGAVATGAHALITDGSELLGLTDAAETLSQDAPSDQ